MKTIKTKQELEQWIIDANNVGYSVPCVINGGGFTLINDWQHSIELTGVPLSEDDDYDDELEYLKPGEEFEDFRYFLSAEEYDGMVFVRVPHNTGYNQENFDLQFGIYEIFEIE